MSFEIVPGLTYEEYAKPPGVNSSILKMVLKESLATVRAAIDGKITFESEALDFGKAFHDLVLEGKKDYVIRPEEYAFGKKWNMNAAFCQEWVKKQTKPILTTGQAENLEGMAKAVQAHPELSPLLCGKCELSVFVEKDGRRLKARIDLLPDAKGSPIIDFKKARSARPADFVKQMYNLQYHVQAALYKDVLKMADIDREEFWYVAVEEEYPHNIYIAKLADNMMGFLDFGRHQYREAYHTLMEAIRTQEWPTYKSSPAEDHLTPWMMAEIEAATA